MRIVRIIGRLNIGGPALQAITLSERLNSTPGIEDLLITGSIDPGEGDMSYLAAELGYTPLYIREIVRHFSPIKDFIAFSRILRVLFDFRPDIIHTNAAKAGFLGRSAAIFYKLRCRAAGKRCHVVHTFHGHVFRDYFGRVPTQLYLLIERFLARFTDAIIALSESQRRDLYEHFRIGRESQYHVIPLGFRLEPFLGPYSSNSNLRRELNLDQDQLLVGIIARLTSIKNHSFFLRVAREAIHSGVRAKFLIIGDGELRASLEKEARQLNLEEDVFFLGWRRDVTAVYADLDVVCLTSLNEGTPVTLIEAQASAKPVVATDVGGVRDVVSHGQSGYIVPAGDLQRFTHHLLDLLSNPPKRNQFGQTGRKQVSTRFTFDRLVEDHLNLYRRLLQAE